MDRLSQLLHRRRWSHLHLRPRLRRQTKVAKGDYPYGIPVPGKPHLVESPYSPGKYIDVEGFPPGTEVKDPYTDKIFLVP